MSDTKDIKMLLNRREALDTQVKILKERRDTLFCEINKWTEQIDTLNVKSREVWKTIKTLKGKRDEANEAVKKLKIFRIEIISKSKIKREEFLRLKKMVKERSWISSDCASSIKNHIDRLDWEIQTNSLSPAKENEIVEQIRLLEKKLLFHKETISHQEKLSKFSSELDILRIQDKETKRQIEEFSSKSREYHKKMLERFNQIKSLKEKANNIHKQYLKCREVANDTQGKYIETIKQIKILNARIREIDDFEYKERINQQTEKAIEIANKKLKDNRKITLEEFKLLKQKGLI